MSENTPQQGTPDLPDGQPAVQQPSAQPAVQQPYAPAQQQPAIQQPYAQNPYAQNPYPQQQYAPQPYAQQAYVQPGYPQQYAAVAYAPYTPAQPRGLSITAMVLGLVSILFWFTFLVPIGALVLGIIGLKKEPAGRGMAITGIVLGSVCLAGTIIVIALWIFFVAAAVGTAGVIGTTNGYSS